MGEFAFSQIYDPANGFHCEEDLEEYLIAGYSPSSLGGFFKPERTNNYPGTNSNSVFRILIIFVQFDNDTIDVNNSNWPSGSAPAYMNNLLATDRYNDYGSSWWDAYSESNAKLSDYWMELSRGNLHVTGEAHHLTLEHPWYWYNSNGGLAQINTEIYDSLDLKLGTRWNDFDNWAYQEGTYKYQQDGKIDMMYVVYRTWRNVGVTPGSVATLYASNQGNEHVTVSNDTIIAGFGQLGSGCTYTPGAPGGIASPFSADKFAPLQAHELGHYHFGWCHARYGIMAGGDCGFFTGLDSRHSPWETIKLGYGVAQLQTTSKTNYGLFDFSSRDNNDTLQVVQVPVSGSNEFFLIASRIKKSSYDRIMAGDTAHDNPFRDINSGYGKGVYIFHTPSGYDYPPLMDQECADGLFNWTNSGNSIPDWSINQELPFYVKSSVSYRNDSNSHYSGSLLDADEKSLGTWFGIGKRHTTLNEDGTDRIFTNDNNIWTSRA